MKRFGRVNKRKEEIQAIKKNGIVPPPERTFASKGTSFQARLPLIGGGHTDHRNIPRGFVVPSNKNKNNSASISSSSSSTGPIIPPRLKREESHINLPERKKMKVSDSTMDSDDDFKQESTSFFNSNKRGVSLRSKKNLNPFSKKPSPILTIRPPTENDPLYQIDDTDDHDFRGAREVLNLPPKSRQDLSLPNTKRKNIKTAEGELTARENEKLLNSLKRAQKQFEYDADKKKCPFCSEILHPMNEKISNTLNMIEEKDRKFKEKEIESIEKENANSSFKKPIYMTKKRQASLSEKDEFCKLHHIELIVKPQGEENDYPTAIDFDDIKSRVACFDKELKDVISDRLASDYRKIAEQAYKDEGATRARSAISVMNRFQRTLPGYYGPKGSIVILNALTKMYLDTGYLAKHLVSPQLPLEFLQQVLVPEAGFRLIRQDMMKLKGITPNVSDRAKEVMLESIEYGSAIFPSDDADIDDNETIL